MNHAEVIELIPAYALHALDEAEMRQVAAHIERCTSCQSELDAYQETTARMALTVSPVAPPPDLKRRLMSRVDEPVAERRASWWEQLQATLRSWGPVWVPVSSALIALLVISNVILFQQSRQPAPPQVITVTLGSTDAAPGASAVLVLTEQQTQGVLVINDLPTLSEAQQYQLWLITPEGTRDSGAVFSVNPDGQAQIEVIGRQALPEYAAFGVTIEPAGGSPGPTGQQVLGSNL